MRQRAVVAQLVRADPVAEGLSDEDASPRHFAHGAQCMGLGTNLLLWTDMTSSPPIRVLLIGTSFGGAVHAPGFASDPAFRLVGVASGHEENARKVAVAHGIPHASADWKKMLDEVETDLVAIASPWISTTRWPAPPSSVSATCSSKSRSL
jgi:hypothetical protein